MTDSDVDGSDLSKLPILIVEDEYYVADDLARVLGERGATVLGTRCNPGGGRETGGTRRFDCAVLDMNLRGEWLSNRRPS